jgi:hypothetical protein
VCRRGPSAQRGLDLPGVRHVADRGHDQHALQPEPERSVGEDVPWQLYMEVGRRIGGKKRLLTTHNEEKLVVFGAHGLCLFTYEKTYAMDAVVGPGS